MCKNRLNGWAVKPLDGKTQTSVLARMDAAAIPSQNWRTTTTSDCETERGRATGKGEEEDAHGFDAGTGSEGMALWSGRLIRLEEEICD